MKAPTDSSAQTRIASIGKLNYLPFFGLATPPFRNTAEVQALFLNEQLGAALGQLEARLGAGESGVFLVKGASGSGKTTLVSQVVEPLRSSATVAWVNRTLLSEVEFLRTLLAALGAPHAEEGGLDACLACFADFCRLKVGGNPCILVIDEAQNLSPALLQLLPKLFERMQAVDITWSVVLVGQDSLDLVLGQTAGEGIRGSIRAQWSLSSLSAGDTAAYIGHQLQIASGGGANPFTEGAMARIHQHTAGSMRLINTLSDFVLFNAFLGGIKRISPELVQTTFNALHWEPIHGQDATEEDRTAATDPGKARLILEYEDAQEFVVAKDIVTIGRSADNDVCIRDLRVSRYHAKVTVGRQGFTIEDLGSTNGVYVNRERVKARLLNDGDVIGIDVHQMRFVQPS